MFGFGRRAASKGRTIDEIIKEIEDGEPRQRPLKWFEPSDADPQINRPQGIAFYDLFSWFPIALEAGSLPGCWTIDATNATTALGDGERQFIVYYNRLRMGAISVYPDAITLLDHSKTPGAASIEMSLDNLRYVFYPDALALVQGIEILVGGPWKDYDDSRAGTMPVAAAALSGHLWEVMRRSKWRDPNPTFRYHRSGPFTCFYDSVQHWQQNGVQPQELFDNRNQ